MLSIVVPVGDADHLHAQLASLADQRFDDNARPDWELILVDDGAGTALADAVQSTGVADACSPRIITGERRGAYRARNVGAKAAEGDRLAFCDADDVVAPNWVGAVSAALDTAALVTGPLDLLTLNEPDDLIGRYPSDWLDRPRVGNRFLPYAMACNLGIRRSLLAELGGFADRRHGGDKALCWDAQLAGHELAFDASMRVAYRLRSTGRGVAVRHFRIARSAPSLYGRYRDHGMPRDSANMIARDVLAMSRAVARPGDRAARQTATAVAAKRAGRLAGSVIERRWYP